MKTDINRKDGKATIHIAGRFDYQAHREFRHAYDNVLADADAREIVVDLSAVDYVDSSALGMLLVLKDAAAAKHRKVCLKGAKGSVTQVLEIACFGKMFSILP